MRESESERSPNAILLSLVCDAVECSQAPPPRPYHHVQHTVSWMGRRVAGETERESSDGPFGVPRDKLFRGRRRRYRRPAAHRTTYTASYGSEEGRGNVGAVECRTNVEESQESGGFLRKSMMNARAARPRHQTRPRRGHGHLVVIGTGWRRGVSRDQISGTYSDRERG